MDTELDPLGIVQIAEEIEYRRIRWYERLASLCTGARARDLCRELAAWSRQQASGLASLGASFRAAAPPDVTTYHGDSIASNARLMAALAFFVAENSASEIPTAVTCEWMLTDAINRSRQAVVFYDGLKGFARDQAAKEVMDEIVQQESEHLHQMLRRLEPYQQARSQNGRYFACVC
jgi:rubrerythrin